MYTLTRIYIGISPFIGMMGGRNYKTIYKYIIIILGYRLFGFLIQVYLSIYEIIVRNSAEDEFRQLKIIYEIV